MSLNKKGFAQLIEGAIIECKEIREKSKKIAEELYLSTEKINIEENNEYKYHRYMEKLVSSKLERLYISLSNSSQSRILSMTDEELEEYRNEKLMQISNEINRLMLSMEVAKLDMEKLVTKEKIEVLMEEQVKLKEKSKEELKEYVIVKFHLMIKEEDSTSDASSETMVLENITKDKETLDKFFAMLKEYRTLEREIKTTRGEQIIIYNDLLARNIKSEMSIDEMFSNESLTKLQSKMALVLEGVNDLENSLKKNFSAKNKNAYNNIKRMDYKYNKDGKILPYDKNSLEIFKDMIPVRTYELANLQNEEWIMLSKKIFKTTDVNERIAGLCMEIDETKTILDSCIRNWYKETYCDSKAFGPVSSRASGKFEYSLGAKDSLFEFVNFGVWPEDKELTALKLALKLNKQESEKSIIYVEQIKERLTRLYNDSLENKKKELETLENKMTEFVGNWNNPIILSIINEI